MTVTIRYGTGNELTKDFPEGTTLGCVLKNQHVRGALGYGQDVEGCIGSVPQAETLVLFHGVTISVNDKPKGKAA